MNEWCILDALVPIVLSHVQGCIVEIGLGNSTVILAKYAKEYRRKHYACDMRTSVCSWVDKNANHQNLIVYNCKSDYFLKQFSDKAAIIFLDGNHHYAVIKQEVNILLPNLVDNGMMFLHDTYLCNRWYERYKRKGKESDTYKIRQDLEKNNELYTMTFPYTAAYCGLTVVLKKEVNRAYYQQ